MALAHLDGRRARRVRRSPSGSSRTCSGPTCRCCASTTPSVPETDAELRPAGASWAGAGRSSGSALMVVLTPLGLLAPGGAFGEDAPGRPRPARSTTSTRVPDGLRQYAGFWHHALLGGYGFTRRRAPGARLPRLGGRRHRRHRRASIVAMLFASPVVRARGGPAHGRDEAGAARHERSGRSHAAAGCCKARSACARAAASARARRAASSRRRSPAAPNVMRQAMFADDMAAQRGLLQRIDPRVKLVTLLGAAGRRRARPQHPGAARACTRSRSCSPWRRGCRSASSSSGSGCSSRSSPGIVVLPATFSFITPGAHRGARSALVRHPVGLTAQGLRPPALIVTRVATSISLVVLLTLTTPWAGCSPRCAPCSCRGCSSSSSAWRTATSSSC